LGQRGIGLRQGRVKKNHHIGSATRKEGKEDRDGHGEDTASSYLGKDFFGKETVSAEQGAKGAHLDARMHWKGQSYFDG